MHGMPAVWIVAVRSSFPDEGPPVITYRRGAPVAAAWMASVSAVSVTRRAGLLSKSGLRWRHRGTRRPGSRGEWGRLDRDPGRGLSGGPLRDHRVQDSQGIPTDLLGDRQFAGHHQ